MTAWQGVLAPLNTESGDGRILVLDDGQEPQVRPLPLPLHAQRQLGEGHDGGVVVGRINRIWVDGGNLMGEGDFDMADPEAAEWVRKLDDGFAGGVSVDLDRMHMVEIPRDRDGQPIDMDALAAQLADDPDAPVPEMGSSLYRTEEWRVMGATLVSHPAFAEARISLTIDADSGGAAGTDTGEFVDAPGGRMPPELHRYWTKGKGLARWAETPTPYRSLVKALTEEIHDMTPEQINGLAANLYHDVFGKWPGKHDDSGKHTTRAAFATDDSPAPDTGTGEDDPNGDDPDNAEQEHTGGMIALIPTDADAARFAVDGGDPADELHVTLVYLGDDVTDWGDDKIGAVAQAVQQAAPGTIDGEVFGHAQFNGECAVYLIEAAGLTDLAAAMREAVAGAVDVPDPSYDGFIPHMTAGWDGMDVAALTELGPIRFDRVRVAVAGKATDIPLEPVTDSLTAAGIIYHADDFRDPGLDGPTKLTVDDDGRVYGHLAAWGTCHIGYRNRCVTPETSRAAYRYFHRGAIDTDEGSLDVGLLTMGTGHARLGIGQHAALAHYDDTGTQIAVIRCGEDAHGIWVSGHLVPGVSDEQVDTLRRSSVSGDWRGIRGNRELIAALVVNVPGFPIPQAEAMVASAADVGDLVAAGIVMRTEHTEVIETIRAISQRVDAVRAELAQESLARIDSRVDGIRRVHNQQRVRDAQRRVAAAMGER